MLQYPNQQEIFIFLFLIIGEKIILFSSISTKLLCCLNIFLSSTLLKNDSRSSEVLIILLTGILSIFSGKYKYISKQESSTLSKIIFCSLFIKEINKFKSFWKYFSEKR